MTSADSTAKILVPLDGSELALQILDHVTTIALRLNAIVVLLRAIPGLADTMTGSHVALDIAAASVEEERKAAQEYLDGVAVGLRAKGLAVEVSVVEGAAAPAILHHLDGIMMIGMTTHSRSGLGRTLFGSVSDEVVRNSHIPVLIFHPGPTNSG